MCVCARGRPRKSARECVCVSRGGGVTGGGGVCICIPPSPQAVLCIVVGMAYMLTQACLCVVQYTRLPIYAALQSHVRGPASFTFAPELMLVNCHISSDLLACSFRGINRAQRAIAVLVFALMNNTRMAGLTRSIGTKAAAVHAKLHRNEVLQKIFLRLKLKANLCCAQFLTKTMAIWRTQREAAVQVFHSRAKQWVWRQGGSLSGASALAHVFACTCVWSVYLPARSECVKFS